MTWKKKSALTKSHLRTVPPFATAHSFCASSDGTGK